MRPIAAALFGLAFLSLSVRPAAALESLDDSAMESVSGAGVALGFDNFQFAMAPTSYFEQVGSAPVTCTSYNVPVGCTTLRRGDLRWYGVNISNAGGTNDGYHWNDTTQCSSSSLGCPRGGTIANFSPFDNPYLIRAWSPSGMDTAGNCINGSAPPLCTGAGAITKTVYEFLAPTMQPNYTFSWWGEIETGSTRDWSSIAAGTANPLSIGAGNVLKSQNIIRGNAAGSAFRAFILADAANPTFAMLYHSKLQGDYRFSVNQAATDGGVVNDTIGQAPVFAATEGMTFRNVNAYVPVGQLYYQALTIEPVGSAGGFAINLSPINDAVSTRHYAFNATEVLTGCTTAVTNPCTYGYRTALASNKNPGSVAATSAQYQLTHGYSRWGDWNATGGYTTNAINFTGDGIVFNACPGCTFYAYADTPVGIDKRANLPSGGGRSYAEQRVQNYNCPNNNTGSTATCLTSAPGPITQGTDATPAHMVNGALNRTFATTAVNLGDSRIEGLMINQLRIETCATGNC